MLDGFGSSAVGGAKSFVRPSSGWHATPTLIITGDEDEPCLEPALLMKRTIPTAGLVVLPKSGHTINLEEPEAFNRAVLDFVTAVDAGRWTRRNPDSLSTSAILRTKKP